MGDTIVVILFLAFIVWCILSERKILKVLGLLLLLSVLWGMFLLGRPPDHSDMEARIIVYDLRQLKSAAMIFRREHDRWLMPGEEASLDMYCDRPIVTTKKFADIMLSEELSNANGNVCQYVGVELIPMFRFENNNPIRVQKRLASRAKEAGLFQEVQSGDVTLFELYQSGLKVFMQLR